VSVLDGEWRKSTRSSTNGSCVEVRKSVRTVQVRDTKDRGGPVLTFPEQAWQEFITAVQGGQFDL
jgi:hypothetical protein